VKTVSTYRTRLMEKMNISYNSDLTYYALNKRGEFGSAGFYSGTSYAVHDGREARIADSAYLFERPHN